MKTNHAFALAVLSFTFFFAVNIGAQEAAKALPERLPLEKADLDRPTMKDLDHGKKIVGRLPSGYRNVVTSSQRDEIYKIQKEYTHLIELMKLRIKLMEMERDRKIDALLTEEQAVMIRKDLGVLESEKHLKRGEDKVVRLDDPKPVAVEEPKEEPKEE